MTNHTGNGGNANGSNGKTSGGPKNPITDSLAKPLAKRFYTDVSVKDGAFFQVLLDGRVIKTPAKRALMLPTRGLAAAVAAEWAAQEHEINPAFMPLTRYANTAIDAVSNSLEEVARDIVSYAGSDLICYRATDQPPLASLQAAAWDPLLTWAREDLRAPFKVTEGIVHVEQPQGALFAFAAALEPHEAFRLTGLHVMTTLTGSALLALAHSRGMLSRDSAWAAAHVDEDYQIGLWGRDEEADARQAARQIDFNAASELLSLLA